MSGQISLQDFFQVERAQFLRRARGLRLWDPRLKLFLATIGVLANVLLIRWELSVALLALAFVGFQATRVPLKHAAIFFVAPLWATIVVMIGYSFGFGHNVLFEVGPVSVYREGVLLGLAAGLRVVSEMSWIGLLILTTPFTEILDALRWFRVPAVLVDTLAFMYRYVFLLCDEFLAMRASARTRGGLSTYKGSLNTLGLVTSQVFLRAYDRSLRISHAMRARGGG